MKNIEELKKMLKADIACIKNDITQYLKEGDYGTAAVASGSLETSEFILRWLRGVS